MTHVRTAALSWNGRGFTLLEVLVALTVLAIGALGLLSMASVATGRQQEAIFRLRAIAAVDDLAGRVHANPAGLDAYAGPAVRAGCTSDTSPAVRCNPGMLAADDLAGWRSRHLPGLPGAGVEIDFVSDTAPPGLRVHLSWRSRSRQHGLSRWIVP